MNELTNKPVLVIGLGRRGRAACGLLCGRGAKVMGVDGADTPELRAEVSRLRRLGAEVALGVSTLPRRDFDLAVLSATVPPSAPLVQEVLRGQIPLIGELELGFQQAHCLGIAITGTNGKSTTAALVERLLASHHRQTLLAGGPGQPLCAVVEETKQLDFLVLEVNASQLELTHLFRPAVAVVTNLAPSHPDPFASQAEYARASARVFQNQQAFDWTIVQSEALARLRELHVPIPGKLITFSAQDREADLYLDRRLLISRLPNWAGPLLDLAHCELRGPHNAENLMAALAVGHVLRLPLETMADAVKTFAGGRHRFELVAELNGVQFINDAKAANPDALCKALLAARPGPGGEPNVWLIAGGAENGLEYHDLGPRLSQHVKHAFLLGAAGEQMRAAWSLFTPCTVASSLLEAVAEAAERAAPGDVVLLSPACSSPEPFRDYQRCGEAFCQAVKSIGRGVHQDNPNIHGITAPVYS